MIHRRRRTRGAWPALLLAGLAAACEDAALPTAPGPEPSMQASVGAAQAAEAAQSAAVVQDALERLVPGLGQAAAGALLPSLRDATDQLAAGDAEAALAALDRAEEVLGQQAVADPDPERDAIRLAIHAARAGLPAGQEVGL